MEKLREDYRNLERFYAEDMNKMTHIINSLSDNAQVFITSTSDNKIVGEVGDDIKIGDVIIDDGSVVEEQRGFIYKVEGIREEELTEWLRTEFSSLTENDDTVICAKFNRSGDANDGKYYVMNTEVKSDLKREDGIEVTVNDESGEQTIVDEVSGYTVNIKPVEGEAFVVYKKYAEVPTWLSVKVGTSDSVSFCDDATQTSRTKEVRFTQIVTGVTAYTTTEIVVDGVAVNWLSFKPGDLYFKAKNKVNDSDVMRIDFIPFVKKTKVVTVIDLSVLNDGSGGGGGSAEGHVYNEEKHSLAEGRYTIATGYDSHAEGYGIWCKVRILSYDSNSVTVKLLDPEYESASGMEGERLQCNNSVKLKEEYESFRRLGYQFNVTNEPDNEISNVTFEEVSTEKDYYYYRMIISFSSNLHGTDNWWQKDYVELIMENRAENNGSHSEGKGTFALGRNTHSEGLLTLANNDNAHAEGHLTKATGLNSHAEGLRTIASGENSHAEGYSDGNIDTEIIVQSINTNDKTLTVNHIWYEIEHRDGESDENYLGKGTAIEYQGYKFAIINVNNTTLTVRGEITDDGYDSIYLITTGSYVQVLGSVASGKFSHVEGRTTCAMGESSHAEGENTIASGGHSHSEGQGTVAYGFVSHAEGIHTLANESYSHSEGEETKALGRSSHAEGSNTTASDYSSHAEGCRTSATTEYSHAEGCNTKASGTASHAEGDGTTASGYYSHAEGRRTTASGYISHAEGQSTKASGTASHTEGDGTTASGYYSHAEGDGTTASGYYSHAEGQYTTASGDTSHAEGAYTEASGEYSHAEGSHTKASGEVSHAEGHGSKASGYSSHAEGEDTTASGENSHAEGSGTKASSYGSHAEGNGATASGYYSHAEGRNTTASRNYTHAEGRGTEASGEYSHAEGEDTKASGRTSHAEGGYTEASGEYSHAEGYKSIASGHSSHAECQKTKATGRNSHSEGYLTESSGIYSHAEGFQTTASGYGSHAEGCRTSATTEYSHAEGCNTKASGTASHAEGDDTTASGYVSHAEGSNTKASGEVSHAEGEYTEASGEYSHAEGRYTRAIGDSSHAEGLVNNDEKEVISIRKLTEEEKNYVYQYHNRHYEFIISSSTTPSYNNGRIFSYSNDSFLTEVTGCRSVYINGRNEYLLNVSNPNSITNDTSNYTNYYYKPKESHIESQGDGSHVEGYTTDGGTIKAEGKGSHAEGYATEGSIIAYGDGSHAEGINTIAKGEASHAEGYETVAEGKNTHAEGFKTKAIGEACHSEGFKTEASGKYNHVEGYGWYEIIGNDVDTNNEFTGHTQDEDYVVITSMISSSWQSWIYVNTLYNDDEPFIKEDDIVSIDIDDERVVPCKIESIDYGNRRFSVYSDWSYLSDLITYGKTKLRKYHGITIGSYNHIEGFGCESSGRYNHIEGYECKDNGCRYNHIEGFRTEVSGYYSHVEGGYTRASGQYSHAEGFSTESSGMYSHAEGSYTIAFGNHSHAEGFSTESSGKYSHAEGFSTEASGIYSHAEGSYTRAYESHSHAEGFSTEASGIYSHAEGSYTRAYESHSHAEGFSTEASGYYSHAEGEKTVAIGVASHAEGGNQEKKKCYIEVGSWTINDSMYYYRTASYIYPGLNIFEKPISTLKLGTLNNVYEWQNYYYFDCSGVNNSGTYYLSNETNGSYASGVYSHAEGSNTETNNISEHAEGQFNMSHSEDSEIHGLSGNTQHSIGIGYYDYDSEDEHRKNAFEVMQNGDAYLYGVGGYDGTNPDSATRLQDLFGGRVYNVEKDSLAEGTNGTWTLNTASGIRSHAEGSNTTASGTYSHAEGYSTKASGYSSHAEGEDTTASGENSHAEGSDTKAYGYASHAEGNGATASFYYSHAEGLNTTASSYGSHAEGQSTKALGRFSHAEGSNTEASGSTSHAEGSGTTASTNYSHAEGYNTQAISGATGEHAEGMYNISHSNTISSIGYGNNINRANAFEVLSDGGVYVQGIGGYTGQNDPNSLDVKSLQEYIQSLEDRIRQLENNQ